MEPQNNQSSTQPWGLSDNLREALDSRVKSFLESLDDTRTSTSYSKAMNAWGVTPRRDSVQSEGESSTIADKADEADEATPEVADTLALDADHSLDAQIMLVESVALRSTEQVAVESVAEKKVRHPCIQSPCFFRTLTLTTTGSHLHCRWHMPTRSLAAGYGRRCRHCDAPPFLKD